MEFNCEDITLPWGQPPHPADPLFERWRMTPFQDAQESVDKRKLYFLYDSLAGELNEDGVQSRESPGLVIFDTHFKRFAGKIPFQCPGKMKYLFAMKCGLFVLVTEEEIDGQTRLNIYRLALSEDGFFFVDLQPIIEQPLSIQGEYICMMRDDEAEMVIVANPSLQVWLIDCLALFPVPPIAQFTIPNANFNRVYGGFLDKGILIFLSATPDGRFDNTRVHLFNLNNPQHLITQHITADPHQGMPPLVEQSGFNVVTNGILIVGGEYDRGNGYERLAEYWVLNTQTFQWHQVASQAPCPLTNPHFTFCHSGNIYVWGDSEQHIEGLPKRGTHLRILRVTGLDKSCYSTAYPTLKSTGCPLSDDISVVFTNGPQFEKKWSMAQFQGMQESVDGSKLYFLYDPQADERNGTSGQGKGCPSLIIHDTKLKRFTGEIHFHCPGRMKFLFAMRCPLFVLVTEEKTHDETRLNVFRLELSLDGLSMVSILPLIPQALTIKGEYFCSMRDDQPEVVILTNPLHQVWRIDCLVSTAQPPVQTEVVATSRNYYHSAIARKGEVILFSYTDDGYMDTSRANILNLSTTFVPPSHAKPQTVHHVYTQRLAARDSPICRPIDRVRCGMALTPSGIIMAGGEFDRGNGFEHLVDYWLLATHSFEWIPVPWAMPYPIMEPRITVSYSGNFYIWGHFFQPPEEGSRPQPQGLGIIKFAEDDIKSLGNLNPTYPFASEPCLEEYMEVSDGQQTPVNFYTPNKSICEDSGYLGCSFNDSNGNYVCDGQPGTSTQSSYGANA